MANVIPEKRLNFSVYLDGDDMLGIAEGTMPTLEFMTSEIKGAGIAGVIDSPGFGQLNSVTFELTWRTVTDRFMALATPIAHEFDMYGADLSYDSGQGQYVTRSVHIFMKALTKKCDMGKLVVADSVEAQTEHEVYYMKLDIDGHEYLEMDKLAYIYKVDGHDYLADVRRALGK